MDRADLRIEDAINETCPCQPRPVPGKLNISSWHDCMVNLSVGRDDLVGVAAMVDRLYPILGIERLEIGNLAAAHHHAAHLTATLRGFRCVAGLVCIL